MTTTDPNRGSRGWTGPSYRDRPAAFGIALREGKIALVRVTRPEGTWHDLPGGALDPGEDDPAALVREFGEDPDAAFHGSGAIDHIAAEVAGA